LIDKIAEARELGYEIEPEGNQTMRVRGFGLNTCYAEDNEQAWEDLIEGHEVRKEEWQ
jgi:hypothetical protein